MSEIPADLKYTKSHEWMRTLSPSSVEIGITDHAQAALGDLVFVEIPAVGSELTAGAACAVVESVKAASDIYSPVNGTVAAANTGLANEPELLNREPYAAGWLIRIDVTPGQAPPLLSAAEYAAYLAESGE